jgi:hypothetical protein
VGGFHDAARSINYFPPHITEFMSHMVTPNNNPAKKVWKIKSSMYSEGKEAQSNSWPISATFSEFMCGNLWTTRLW